MAYYITDPVIIFAPFFTKRFDKLPYNRLLKERSQQRVKVRILSVTVKSQSSSLCEQTKPDMKLIIRHQGSSIGSDIVQYNILNVNEEKLGGHLVGVRNLIAKFASDSAFGKWRKSEPWKVITWIQCFGILAKMKALESQLIPVVIPA